MADIELVIKIDEKDYKEVLEINNRECDWNNMHSCYEAVLNGIPLPKGHGRLIDADVLVDGMEDDYEFCEAVNATPTIVETDKESEEV